MKSTTTITIYDSYEVARDCTMPVQTSCDVALQLPPDTRAAWNDAHVYAGQPCVPVRLADVHYQLCRAGREDMAADLAGIVLNAPRRGPGARVRATGAWPLPPCPM